MTSTTDPVELAEYFDAEITDDATVAKPSYNVAPTDPGWWLPTPRRSPVRHEGVGVLVSFYTTDASDAGRMINARAETVAETSTYRRVFERCRCLIPVDGFYEWQKIEGKRRPSSPVTSQQETAASSLSPACGMSGEPCHTERCATSGHLHDHHYRRQR